MDIPSLDAAPDRQSDSHPAPYKTSAASEVTMPQGASAKDLGGSVLQGGPMDSGFGELADTGDEPVVTAAAGDDRDLFGEGRTGASGAAPDMRHDFLSFFADRVALANPEAADTIRGYRDSGPGESEERGGVATLHDASMEDLTGVKDPHSMLGGFAHDLGRLLPWGGLLETEYDRACQAWQEQHPGTLV